MLAYLREYGHHFSKKLCYWAISNMRDRNNRKVEARSKEQVDNILKTYNVDIQNNKGYDSVFVFHMGISDYLGSSMVSEQQVAKYVKDVLDDKDGYDGIAFCRFIADCNGSGTPISWEDML